MEEVEIFIPGRNKAKDRPRASVGKNGKPFMWTPKKTLSMEKMIREDGEQARHLLGLSEPHRGPVHIMIYNIFQKPKAWWEGKEPMGGFGDWDNLAKTVCDGLNKTLFCDDAQITRGTSIKMYSEDTDEPSRFSSPGVLIVIQLYPFIEKPKSKRLTRRRL